MPTRLTSAWKSTGSYFDLAETVRIETPETTLYILADHVSLREMIRNIVENSLIYAPGPVEIEMFQHKNHINLIVRDRGAGIPADIRTRIFDRFVRADQAKPGSGLGLSIAKMVAEACGGQILIESRAGGGTEMIVRFPAVHIGDTSA